jgi:hypothetical protein
MRSSRAGETGAAANRCFGEQARETTVAKAAATGESTPDPRVHTWRMRQRFEELIDHLRGDIDTVNEPQFKAMCETAAEVLGGLRTAFRHYEERAEPAWRVQ